MTTANDLAMLYLKKCTLFVDFLNSNLLAYFHSEAKFELRTLPLEEGFMRDLGGILLQTSKSLKNPSKIPRREGFPRDLGGILLQMPKSPQIPPKFLLIPHKCLLERDFRGSLEGFGRLK